MVVKVRDGNVQKAIMQLKRRLQKSGRDRELARKASYMKPSEQRRTDHRRALKRIRKAEAHYGPA